MTCPTDSVRDYFLGELPEAERTETRRHLNQCGECASELARLQIVQASLGTLIEEEPPRRIGFVSDKVFEPSPVRRWWSAFWLSGARMGFAGAAMLSAALVFSATRPVPVTMAVPLQPAVVQAASFTPAEVQARIDRAVAAEERKTRDLLAASEKKHEMQERALNLRLETSFDMLQKRYMTTRSIAMNFNEGAQ